MPVYNATRRLLSHPTASIQQPFSHRNPSLKLDIVRAATGSWSLSPRQLKKILSG